MKEKTLSLRLAEELKKLRKEQGWTQSQLAQEASATLPDNERIYQTDISSFEKTGGILSLNKIDAAFSVFGKELCLSEKKTLLMSA